MCRPQAGHRLNPVAIVFDFAQEKLAIQRRAMTMRVQLNIGAGGGKSLHFVWRQQVHNSRCDQRVVIQLELSRQYFRQRGLLFRRRFLRLHVPLNLAESIVTRSGGAQFNLQILTGDSFQIERLALPFPKQIFAKDPEDGFVVIRIEGREVKRNWKTKLLQERKCTPMEIEVTIVKSYRDAAIGQVVFVQPRNRFAQWQDSASGSLQLFQPSAKQVRRNRHRTVPEMLVVDRNSVIGQNQKSLTAPTAVLHQRGHAGSLQ